MFTRFAASLVTSLVVITTIPASAHACWDGFSISTDRVAVAVEGDSSWSPEQARNWANWASRIDALVPEGTTLAVVLGDLEICDAAGCTIVESGWDDHEPSTLFDHAALALAAPATTIAAAQRAAVAPLTVQVAAGRNLGAALELARRINDADLGLAGFFDAGGFPSSNAYAHVVESSTATSTTFNVVVGAFLVRGDADAALTMLEAELDLHGFVRPLDQSSIEAEGC